LAIAASLGLAVIAVYLVGIVTGGAVYDFCRCAVNRVLIGIGAAVSAAYISVKENNEQTEKGVNLQ